MGLKRWLYTLPVKLRSLLHRGRLEQELDDELRYHLEQQTELNVAEGMSKAAARLAALRALGGVEQHKEACREARGVSVIESSIQDLRFAARTFRKNPGFTLVAVFTLAIGIGLTTSVFSVVESILLEPLPYPEADRLVTFTVQTEQGERPRSVSGLTFEFFAENALAFEAIAASNSRRANLAADGGGRRVDVGRVTSEFFEVLGASIVQGRAFLPEDEVPGAPQVTILSHDVWQGLFGGRDLLGRQVSMNDISYTVVGILPESFRYPPSIPDAAFVPLADLRSDALFGGLNFSVVGRIRSDMSLDAVRSDMARVFERYAEANSELPANLRGFGVAPLQESFYVEFELLLWVLMGAASLVLLVACANVANLLIVRSSSRQREIATRLAIGAVTGRIIRQLLTESLVLSVLAGLLGVSLAGWGVEGLITLSPYFGFLAPTASINPRVLAFALVVSVLTAIIFGTSGTLHARRINLQDALKASGSIGRSREASRLSDVLIASEVAIALTLLIGAALMSTTFYRLQTITLGFDSENLLVSEISLASERYGTARSVDLFEQQIREGLSSVPGVTSVATASGAPLVGTLHHVAVVEGEAEPNPFYVEYRSVSPEYLETRGIPLRSGRTFLLQTRKIHLQSP